MSRKYIFLIVVGVVLIAIISIVTGMNLGKSSGTSPATPTPYPVFEIEQTAIQTTIPDKEENYKIILQGSFLILYEGEKILNKTEIAPNVLPSSDIKALKTGITYSSLENALVDWESLCK